MENENLDSPSEKQKITFENLNVEKQHINDTHSYSQINIFGPNDNTNILIATKIIPILLSFREAVVFVWDLYQYEDDRNPIWKQYVECTTNNLNSFKHSDKILIIDGYFYNSDNRKRAQDIFKYHFRHIITISSCYDNPIRYMNILYIVSKENDERSRLHFISRMKISDYYDIDDIWQKMEDEQLILISTKNNDIRLINSKSL